MIVLLLLLLMVDGQQSVVVWRIRKAGQFAKMGKRIRMDDSVRMMVMVIVFGLHR